MGFLGAMLWLVGLGANIFFFSFEQDQNPSDAAVVLGAAVWRGRPTPVFRERINHAIQLYQSGTVETIIFTGGVGFGDELAESEAARNYAIQQGVDPNDILIEVSSRNTLENLSEAHLLIDANDFDRILIVSDPIHMKRALEMAEDLGINAFPSPTQTSRYQSSVSQTMFLMSEVYDLAIYLIQRPFIDIRTI